MEELKFRVWDKDGEYMITSRQGVATIIAREIREHDESYDIMQYTGLKDKTEKEIFEYDIVKHLKHGIYHVYFSLIGGIRFQNLKTGNYVCPIKPINQPQVIEVIGNIYENPELLK